MSEDPIFYAGECSQPKERRNKMKIKTEAYPGIRNDCHCSDCDWQADPYSSKNPTNEAKKHIRENPDHSVVRVTGSEFVYTAEKEE